MATHLVDIKISIWTKMVDRLTNTAICGAKPLPWLSMIFRLILYISVTYLLIAASLPPLFAPLFSCAFSVG